MKQKCPKCGNVVEGQIKATFARKFTRAAVKKGSAMATGAAIGSIVPGIGTVIGGAIGLAAGVLMEDEVKKASDVVEDMAFDNSNAEYEFHCPKCGHQWTKNSHQSESRGGSQSGSTYSTRATSTGGSSTSLSYSNSHSNSQTAGQDSEQDAFGKYFDWCAENTEDAISGFAEVETHCNSAVACCENDVVKSEYLFLLSWLRLERLISTGFVADTTDFKNDYDEIKRGYDEVVRAVNLIGSDPEYEALKKIYKLWLGSTGASFESGFAHIKSDPLKGYSPTNNIFTKDYMYQYLVNFRVNH